MADGLSTEVRTILSQADVLARATQQPLSSVHHLVAMCIVQCQARDLLLETGIDDARVLDTFERMAEREDTVDVRADMLRQAHELAGRSNASDVSSTVLLAGLLRLRGALACRVLERAGVNLPGLRARVIGQVTLSHDRAVSSSSLRAARADGARGREQRQGTHGEATPRPFDAVPPFLPTPQPMQHSMVPPPQTMPYPTSSASQGGPRGALETGDADLRFNPLARRAFAVPIERVQHARADRPAVGQPAADGRPPASSADAHFPAADRAPESGNSPSQAPQPGAQQDGRMAGELPLPIELRGRGEPRMPTAPDGPDLPRTPDLRPTVDLRPARIDSHFESRPTLPARPADATLAAAAGVFDLDPDQFPTLREIGRNLTLEALRGRIDPVIGRDALVDQVIEILLMKKVNNPCLIGEAGVGKTALVEGLAARIAGKVREFGRLGGAVIVEVHTSALLAGTSLRGAFSERMQRLRDEMARAEGRVILFVDEIHTIMGAGVGDGALDVANDLKGVLAHGQFPLIGATTPHEYERHIKKDPAMDRRFQPVEVREPSVAEAVAILQGIAAGYGSHHRVRYAHDALLSAVQLSQRFMTDRCLPAKAIDVIDRAGAQAQRAGKTVVQIDDVARAVHQLTQVPLDRLLADERGRIRDLRQELQRRILGQEPAIARIVRRIQRNYAGFSGDRPLASLLFVGAQGVGKTEAARALAEALFVAGDALVRFDMTEYTESHSVARLLGAPPGYTGHGTPGLLAHAVLRRPYRVLLFDEIERAAPEVLNLLMQLLDAGRVMDQLGHMVDVRNCILILTTNAGSEVAAAAGPRRTIGFGRVDAPLPEGPGGDPIEAAVIERVRRVLPAELGARVDETVVFRPLLPDAVREIVRRALAAGAQRLFEARSIRYAADETVVDLVVAGGVDPLFGVRPLRARIETLVEAFVTECILDGRLRPGSVAEVTAVGGHLELHPAGEPAAAGHATVAHAIDVADPSPQIGGP
ncbi:MAG: AAA family ATPase [Myxococcales bacterium]|nr:AAA family ATPase [Myxococcales bacterium]